MTFSAVDFVSYPRSANPADVACHDRLVELLQEQVYSFTFFPGWQGEFLPAHGKV